MVVDTSEDLRNREELSLHQLLAASRILVGAVSHEVRNVSGAIAVVHENLARDGTQARNKDFEALGTLIAALRPQRPKQPTQASPDRLRRDRVVPQLEGSSITVVRHTTRITNGAAEPEADQLDVLYRIGETVEGRYCRVCPLATPPNAPSARHPVSSTSLQLANGLNIESASSRRLRRPSIPSRHSSNPRSHSEAPTIPANSLGI
jgi:hypothetical protein